MEITQCCGVCGWNHKPPMCEKKEPVFCSECVNFYDGIKQVHHGTYRNLKCKSHRNLKEVLTFEKRTYEPIGVPRDLNKNNDCEWFERKERRRIPFCGCRVHIR